MIGTHRAQASLLRCIQHVRYVTPAVYIHARGSWCLQAAGRDLAARAKESERERSNAKRPLPLESYLQSCVLRPVASFSSLLFASLLFSLLIFLVAAAPSSRCIESNYIHIPCGDTLLHLAAIIYGALSKFVYSCDAILIRPNAAVRSCSTCCIFSPTDFSSFWHSFCRAPNLAAPSQASSVSTGPFSPCRSVFAILSISTIPVFAAYEKQGQ